MAMSNEEYPSYRTWLGEEQERGPSGARPATLARMGHRPLPARRREREAARTGGLDLPDENFEYDEFIKREFGDESPVPRGVHWFWWVIALLVVVAFLACWLR